MPTFSVIIATHRRAGLLARALASVRAQRHPFAQVVVVSDCIDHETWQVATAHAGDDDLFIQRQGTPGPALSRNRGMQVARADYLVFLDDDDTFRPDFLADVVAARAGLPINEILYTNFEVIEEGERADGAAARSQTIDISTIDVASIQVKNFIPNNCQIFPRACLSEVVFDSGMAYEDWDFLLSACAQRSPRHVPVFGPCIHKHAPSGGAQRGEQNQGELLDCYLKVYQKHPPLNPHVAALRAQLFASMGLTLPPEALTVRPGLNGAI